MKINTRELVLYAMLGGAMYVSKLLFEAIPNVHIVGALVVAITVVYRKKALYPIYVFVLLTGLLNGFATWWIPYLYIWTALWGLVMLIPKKVPEKIKPFIYMVVCATHGFLYGILYAPTQAILHGLNLEGTIAWIVAGFPFDVIHGISNFLCGILIMPIVLILHKAETYYDN